MELLGPGERVRRGAPLAGAVILHAVAVGIGLSVAPPAPHRLLAVALSSKHEKHEEWTIGLDLVSSGGLASSAPVVSAGAIPRSAPPAARPTTSGARGNDAAEAAGASTTPLSFSFGASHFDVGITPRGHAIYTELPSPSSPDLLRRKASTTGGIVESLDTADQERGLGRGGAVRTAVEKAAHSDRAPVLGTATFAVDVLADGTVNVSLEDASANPEAWASLAAVIRAQVSPANLRIPPHARGLRVTVRVEATEQFPGGGRPPTEKELGAAVHGSVGKVTETKDHIEIELPSVALTYQTRNCSAVIGLSAGGISAGAGCSAGVAQRVVSTRILGEQRL